MYNDLILNFRREFYKSTHYFYTKIMDNSGNISHTKIKLIFEGKIFKEISLPSCINVGKRNQPWQILFEDTDFNQVTCNVNVGSELFTKVRCRNPKDVIDTKKFNGICTANMGANKPGVNIFLLKK